MATPRKLFRSFAGGEVSPEMFGRVDDVKNQTGLGTCRNFIPKPQGPIESRPGFRYVRTVKDSAKKTRLLPFTFSTTQTMVLEFGAGYLRFHTDAATLLSGSPAAYSGATAYVIGDMVASGGVNYYCVAPTTGNSPPNASFWYPMPVSGEYEIPTPYAEADLFDVHYVQSNDVLTLVHPNYAPRELRRAGATNWQLSAISFAAPTAPAAPTVVASGHTVDKYTYSYVVTAIGADGLSESQASTAASDAGNLFESGGIVTISWSAVAGATRYNVYKLQGGLYGYIGTTESLSIIDDNIGPDLGKTPPRYESVFGSTGNYPGAVSYFEQRRVFAGTTNDPQTLWMTKSGTESNMSFGLPILDNDRIKFRVAARESNTIRHVVPLSGLVLLTSSAEWRVTSVNSDAITASSVSVRPQAYVGASNVQPVIINNTMLYGAARGGHIRELGYQQDAAGFVTGDLCLRAAHLFDDLTIDDMAYAKAPQPIVWFVSSNGNLLGFTYVPEQEVGAWHRHDTDGTFETCAVVAEGSEDYLYVVVRRVVAGNVVRYVERMESRQFVLPENAFFVDCGLTYSGAPSMVISGLSHLEGKTVSILADGSVQPSRVVTGGQITLDEAASLVQIGLPYLCDVETPPLSVELRDGSFGHGHMKNVNKVWLRVNSSSGIFAGPNADRLVEVKQRTTELPGSPPELKSEEIELTLRGSWADTGKVFVRQADPLPLTLVSMTAEVSVGG